MFVQCALIEQIRWGLIHSVTYQKNLTNSLSVFEKKIFKDFQM